MIINIRCWTCGKPIGHLWNSYKQRVDGGEHAGKVMNSLGLERYCCRSSMLGHIDLIDTVAQFKKF